MEPSVYLESTIPSFIVGEISPVLVTAARQIATRRWWSRHRYDYRLFVSRLVQEEISRGDTDLAQERLTLVAGLPELVIDDVVLAFAKELRRELKWTAVPEQDAIHLAAASHYYMDYLLTWNLTHIANAEVRRAIDRYSARSGTYIATICTPDELLGGEENDD